MVAPSLHPSPPPSLPSSLNPSPQDTSPISSQIDGVETELRELFFDREFNLKDGDCIRRIFAKLQNMEDLEGFLSRSTHLLDNVESELVEEVTAKSAAFFSALSALGSLSDQVSSLATAANNLSTLVSEMETRYEAERSRLEQLNREQLTILEAQRLLSLMADFVKSQQTIQTMLDTHAFGDARKLVDSRLEILSTELAGIELFDAVRLELAEMRVALEKMQRASDMLAE